MADRYPGGGQFSTPAIGRKSAAAPADLTPRGHPTETPPAGKARNERKRITFTKFGPCSEALSITTYARLVPHPCMADDQRARKRLSKARLEMSADSAIVAYRKTIRSSERSFGVTFAVVFAVLGFWPLVFRFEMLRWWALVISLAFLTTALVVPRLLVPLNFLWFKFGMLLHQIVTPILMALIYYGAIVPMGLVLTTARKDLLLLKWDPTAKSYWIARDPPGPAADTMTKQF